MGFLLDTNIISLHMKNPAATFSKFNQHSGQLFTSQIVVAELYGWCFASSRRDKRKQQVLDTLKDFFILPFDDDCAWKFGEISASLKTNNIADLMIAATAVVHSHVLVSHDGDFQYIASAIKPLRVVDWYRPSR